VSGVSSVRVLSPHPDRVWRAVLWSVLLAWLGAGVAQLGLGLDLTAWLSWLPECRIRAWTGFDCPGCGMTRAWLLLAELRVVDAFHTHPLALPMLGATGFAAVRRSTKQRSTESQEQDDCRRHGSRAELHR
jgi:hypothetical protein